MLVTFAVDANGSDQCPSSASGSRSRPSGRNGRFFPQLFARQLPPSWSQRWLVIVFFGVALLLADSTPEPNSSSEQRRSSYFYSRRDIPPVCPPPARGSAIRGIFDETLMVLLVVIIDHPSKAPPRTRRPCRHADKGIDDGCQWLVRHGHLSRRAARLLRPRALCSSLREGARFVMRSELSAQHLMK